MKVLTGIFGANFRTSAWGGITLVATAIAFKPDLIAFLPDSIESYVSGICGLIAFISGGAFVLNTKDRQVTGGRVQQTLDGVPAQPGTQTLVDITKESPPATRGRKLVP